LASEQGRKWKQPPQRETTRPKPKIVHSSVSMIGLCLQANWLGVFGVFSSLRSFELVSH
jgi:hypothetical protein